MSNLAKREAGAIIQADGYLSDEQIETIKNTIAVGATDSELKLFLHTAQRLNLDPFARQVFFVRRKQKVNDRWIDKGETQVSIDGFRVIAERSDDYEGQDGPYWCGEDGEWKDIWLAKTPPRAAKVGVFRKGFRQAIYAVALFDEYAATFFQDNQKKLGPMWTKMPANQLAKCAESLALRKAFPNNLSGVYTKEEMAQAAEPEYEPPAKLPKPRPTLDSIAAEPPGGGERPLVASRGGASKPPSQPAGASETPVGATTGTPTTSSLADTGETPASQQATALRLEYNAWLGAQLSELGDNAAVDPDGLLVPPWACPVFGPDSKHPGKRYDDEKVPAGLLRALLANKKFMAECSTPQESWARYVVCAHEIEKLLKPAKAEGEE